MRLRFPKKSLHLPLQEVACSFIAKPNFVLFKGHMSSAV